MTCLDDNDNDGLAAVAHAMSSMIDGEDVSLDSLEHIGCRGAASLKGLGYSEMGIDLLNAALSSGEIKVPRPGDFGTLNAEALHLAGGI